jgi:hypothetical protein
MTNIHALSRVNTEHSHARVTGKRGPRPVWTAQAWKKLEACERTRAYLSLRVGESNLFDFQSCTGKSGVKTTTIRSKLIGSLVGSLFYDAFSVTRLCSVDNRVTSEWWIGKDLVGSGRNLILRHYPDILVEVLRKPTKNLDQDSRSLGPDLNPGPSEYEARLLLAPRQLLLALAPCVRHVLSRSERETRSKLIGKATRVAYVPCKPGFKRFEPTVLVSKGSRPTSQTARPLGPALTSCWSEVNRIRLKMFSRMTNRGRMLCCCTWRIEEDCYVAVLRGTAFKWGQSCHSSATYVTLEHAREAW